MRRILMFLVVPAILAGFLAVAYATDDTPQAPRSDEQQAPRSDEQQAPRSDEQQAPRSDEQQAPRSVVIR